MKSIKLGIFGMGRGSDFFNDVWINNGEVVAICERYPEIAEKALKDIPVDKRPVIYTDFDEFLNHDMDAVFLANCFHEHAPFAIKALEKGLNVLSECTSNCTMAEGVALVRAAEKAKGIYMIAENYPFMLFNMEMRKVYRQGKLGKALYCEGEYNHPFNPDLPEEFLEIHPYPKHWRNYLPRTYYITHSLAPLMYITGAFPKRVTALPCYAPLDDEFECNASYVGDRAAIITTLNDDDSVYRITGCSAFGAGNQNYRVCGTKGQIENLRGVYGKIMLRYSHWAVPEGEKREQLYDLKWDDDVKELAKNAGHGGGDFFVIREFFNCIREGRKPEFDVHFATTMASTAILGHRSLLEKGMPYDIPDFHKEEDLVKYENDTATPFWGLDGSAPTIPCCSNPDYVPDPVKMQRYIDMTNTSDLPEVRRNEKQ